MSGWIDHAYDSVIRSDPSDPWWRVHYQYGYSVYGQRFARWTWMEVRAETAEEATVKVEGYIAREGRQLQVGMKCNRLDPVRVEPGRSTDEGQRVEQGA